MWDEEKFFSDFVEESKKVKPDAAFIEQLKNKTSKDNVIRLQKRKRMQYMGMAASLFLCLSAAGIGWHVIGTRVTKQGQGGSSYQKELSAGKEGQGEYSGTVDETELHLLKVISMVEDEKNLLDNEQGNSLSTQERKDLAEMLKKAKKIETSVELSQEKISNEGTIYYCVGEETVKIVIYEEKYIMLEDGIYVVEKE